MLKQRIMTAIVLLSMLVPLLLLHNSLPFGIAMLVFMAAGAWEWARLNGMSFAPSVLVAAAFAGGIATIWLQFSGTLFAMGWQAAGLAWVLCVVYLLRAGVSVWSRIPVVLRLLGGLAVLGLAWFAVMALRQTGVNCLLSAFSVVWVADVSAYFAGRAWGQRKLAPSISPGKSWAGVYGAVVGVLVVALAWIGFDLNAAPQSLSVFTQLYQRHSYLGVAWLAAWVAMSVAGDLIESLVKRSAGVKDSSQLLPGHGGVLDRVDALLPVLPCIMATLSF